MTYEDMWHAAERLLYSLSSNADVPQELRDEIDELIERCYGDGD